MSDAIARSVDGIVLAAGSSTRFGERKLLSQLCGKPLMNYALETISRSGIRKIILVVSRYILDDLPPLHEDVEVVLNEATAEGIASSIICGLRNAEDSDAVLLFAADQPLVTAELIRKLVRAGNKQPDCIIASSFRGIPRNPVLIPRRFYGELKSLHGDTGAKAIFERHSGKIRKVELGDETELLDVDTAADLERIRSILTRR